MDSYVELQVLPDPEFSAPTLMNALFAKLHRSLARGGEGRIGISFPDVADKKDGLGSRLRLHGRVDDLQNLMAENWLHGMRDHLACSPIRAVPNDATHRVVRRVQAKSSPERDRRRLMARKGITQEAAIQAIPDSKAQRLKHPYLVLSSQSTKQQFRLFIEHLPEKISPVQGLFSAYGLSAQATIPWF